MATEWGQGMQQRSGRLPAQDHGISQHPASYRVCQDDVASGPHERKDPASAIT